jgi:hypothetical protein
MEGRVSRNWGRYLPEKKKTFPVLLFAHILSTHENFASFMTAKPEFCRVIHSPLLSGERGKARLQRF